jgi:hypothetical protein
MDQALAAIADQAAQVSEIARRKVVNDLRRLADSLEDKYTTYHRFAHLYLEQGTIEVGLNLGVFKYLSQADGPRTVDEIASQSKADPALMRRFLRYWATLNVVEEVSRDTFKATNVTRNLSEEVAEAAFKHYYGICRGQYLGTVPFLERTGYKNPVDETNTAFHVGWDTKLRPFEWMAEHPDQLAHFNAYMATRRKPERTWLSEYPVLDEVGEGADPERVLYVNVGGGIGHQCAQFLDKYPEAPGRIVLQDLPATIEQALKLPRMEAMAVDFFQPQPVKGAKFYYMRGVPHNHPPHKVKLLFSNIRDAMAPDSVMLVDETVLPETGANFIATSIDLTMMGAFASMERTEDDWRELIEAAGLELTKVYRYNPNDMECVMEVRLPKTAAAAAAAPSS